MAELTPPKNEARDIARTRQNGSAPRVLPGLLLSALIAALAFALRQIPAIGVLSPLILAILLGMAFHNLIGTPTRAKAGTSFSVKRVLRAGDRFARAATDHPAGHRSRWAWRRADRGDAYRDLCLHDVARAGARG